MSEVTLTLVFLIYIFIGISFVIKIIDENLFYNYPKNTRFLVIFLCILFLPILVFMILFLHIVDYINEVLKWLSKHGEDL